MADEATKAPPHGVDPAALAARMNQLPKSERQQLQLTYADWILRGTAAGRPWIVSAISVWGLAAAGMGIWWPSPIIIAGFAFAMVVGVWLFRVGARKERLWRQRNPFRG